MDYLSGGGCLERAAGAEGGGIYDSGAGNGGMWIMYWQMRFVYLGSMFSAGVVGQRAHSLPEIIQSINGLSCILGMSCPA